MSKLIVLRVLRSLLTGVLGGFAIIGAEAAFMHQLPAGTAGIVLPLVVATGAALAASVVTHWLEARNSLAARREG